MGRWLEAVKQAPKRLLWLDDTEYCARLLANGTAPWMDCGAWAGWRRSTLKLLQPDVAMLDLSAAAHAWAAARLPAGSSGDVLAQVVCDKAFHEHAGELADALRAITKLPFVLMFSAPGRWLQLLSSRDARGVDEDMLEDAAADVSQLLRALSERPVDAVLLEEDSMEVSQAVERLSCYGSIINVARHYRWDIGVHLPGGAPASHPKVDFFVAPADALGLSLEQGFWRDGSIPAVTPNPSFLFASIPAQEEPHRVLQRLALLR